MMEAHRVDVFLYGSYMNLEVLREVGVKEPSHEAARLPGYCLEIAPLANLVADAGSQAYGIITKLTHEEIDRLYGRQACGLSGGGYKPEAVLAFTIDNSLIPALCYRAPAMQPAAPEQGYVDLIVEAAREHGFPADYVADIQDHR